MVVDHVLDLPCPVDHDGLHDSKVGQYCHYHQIKGDQICLLPHCNLHHITVSDTMHPMISEDFESLDFL